MATTSNLEAAMDRVRDQLAVANGAGDYNYDLSLSDSVQWNPVQIPPPRDPTVYLTDWNLTQEEGRSLTDYFHVLTIGFVGVVSGDTDTENRLRNAARLLADINEALQANRQLYLMAGTPERVSEGVVIRNQGGGYTDAFGSPGFAYCTGEIEYRYALRAQSGV